jgi:hypothetical protein
MKGEVLRARARLEACAALFDTLQPRAGWVEAVGEHLVQTQVGHEHGRPTRVRHDHVRVRPRLPLGMHAHAVVRHHLGRVFETTIGSPPQRRDPATGAVRDQHAAAARIDAQV